LPELILLQHFFVGLNKKTIKHLHSSVGGSFMHITIEQAKDILIKIVDNLPEEDEKLLEEEPKIAEPEILPEPSCRTRFSEEYQALTTCVPRMSTQHI
jgi:hypothetical protein